jgi:hypothetical protein
MVAVESKRTVWEERVQSMKESVRSSSVFLGARRAKRELEVSDNAAVQAVLNIKDDLEDAVRPQFS